MNTNTQQKDTDQEFAELLYESLMPDEEKQEIVAKMMKGGYSGDELEELYLYLLEEKAIREKEMPTAMKKIGDLAAKSVENKLKNNLIN